MPGIDWAAQVALDRAVDPYLAWADLSGWADLPAPEAGLQLLVEGEADGSGLDDQGRHRDCPALVPHTAYVDTVDGLPHLQRVYTARLPPGELGALLAAPSVKRFQLGLPRWTDVSLPAPHDGGSPPRCLVEKGRTVVGVIDDGCPFAHPALRENGSGRSRVIALWDPGLAGPVPHPWQAMAGWTGAQLEPSSLSPALLRESTRVYASLGHAALAARTSSHGSGVSHLAAGALLLGGLGGDEVDAPLAFVQLPEAVIADTSGGAVGVLLLDALQYLCRVALHPSPEDGGRLVVNISYGSLAGPHDGSSLLETGIADLLDREPRLQVVVAAGNGHRSRTHARWRPVPASPQELAWQVGPDHPAGSFLELWLPPGADLAQVEVSLHSPAGKHVQLHGPGSAVLRDGQGRPQAGLVASRKVSQGLHGTLVLAALRPTRARSGLGAAAHGLWRLRVTCGEAACVGDLHAWVERNDLVVGARRRQHAWLVDDGRGVVQASHDLGTLAHGVHPRCHVVGAARLHDGRVCDYSASGPARGGRGRVGPDGVAPGDAGTALHGLLVPAAQAGAHARISGTSAAAALVTRHIAAHGALQLQPGHRPASVDGRQRGGRWQLLGDGRVLG